MDEYSLLKLKVISHKFTPVWYFVEFYINFWGLKVKLHYAFACFTLKIHKLFSLCVLLISFHKFGFEICSSLYKPVDIFNIFRRRCGGDAPPGPRVSNEHPDETVWGHTAQCCPLCEESGTGWNLPTGQAKTQVPGTPEILHKSGDADWRSLLQAPQQWIKSWDLKGHGSPVWTYLKRSAQYCGNARARKILPSAFCG